ncbi:6-phosphogluconolactonase [Acrocarpospora sp. B8E8]|uniref:6-phosphogluconolactonase n=1 Tax=Acrocarpospora sp. B8E8 TaxID=3153572 RepID=UPI00325F146F
MLAWARPLLRRGAVGDASRIRWPRGEEGPRLNAPRPADPRRSGRRGRSRRRRGRESRRHCGRRPWRFTFAVSGGHTPWQMFAALVTRDLPWPNITIFQADERVAPDGDPDRNLTHLRENLGAVGAEVVPMPVTDADLEAAARRYAELLPARFDLVHLGLGPDGHTASLVPADPVLTGTDRLVALTRPYQGHPRMTLTYPALGWRGRSRAPRRR